MISHVDENLSFWIMIHLRFKFGLHQI